MLAIKKQTPYNILQKVYNLLYKYKNKVSNQKNKTATKQLEEAKNLRRTLRTTCSRSRSRRWQRLPLASLLITKTRNSYKNMEII